MEKNVSGLYPDVSASIIEHQQKVMQPCDYHDFTQPYQPYTDKTSVHDLRGLPRLDATLHKQVIHTVPF